MLSPPFPTHCAVTRFVPASIRVIGNPSSVAHTAPAPYAISPPCPASPASIVAVTCPLLMDTRDTVPSPWFSVHTDPAPTVKNRGPFPTFVSDTTLFVTASTRVNKSFPVDVTHTDPPPNAAAYDAAATRIRATTLLVAGSIRTKTPP